MCHTGATLGGEQLKRVAQRVAHGTQCPTTISFVFDFACDLLSRFIKKFINMYNKVNHGENRHRLRSARENPSLERY